MGDIGGLFMISQRIYDQDSASHSNDADQNSPSFIVTRFTTLVTTFSRCNAFHHGEENDPLGPHGHWLQFRRRNGSHRHCDNDQDGDRHCMCLVMLFNGDELHLDYLLDSVYFVHNGDGDGVKVYFHRYIYYWLYFLRIKLFSIYVFRTIGDFKHVQHQHNYWYNHEQHFVFHHHHRLKPTPWNHHVKLLSRIQLRIPHCERKHRFHYGDDVWKFYSDQIREHISDDVG
ncbi:hypothetical protein Trisim1_005772 [Trichoderma cf. simile WF8]